VGQGNNAFIFPGLGMGATLTCARKITDGMVLAAAHALDAYTTEFHLGDGRIYPPASELHAVSLFVAARVALEALEAGVAERDELPRDLDRLHALATEAAYRPEYVPITRG
jgi:malate dehydrogenase (oxaloacetate-decarboxylating)